MSNIWNKRLPQKIDPFWFQKKKVVAPGYYLRKENTVTWFQQSLFLYPLSQM